MSDPDAVLPPVASEGGAAARAGVRSGGPAPRPFVKWVGGKRQLLPHILDKLQVRSGRYHEPFLGGGAVFFALWSRGVVETARLSDMNLRLIRTWRAVQQDVDGVVERLDHLARTHDKDQYYEVRSRDVDAYTEDADVAAWFIYLNKTGFNGLYRVNKSGGFNVPMGRYRKPRILDEANLRAAHRALACAEILPRDFASACALVDRDDAVYFDPPYVPLTRTANFTSYTAEGFDAEDQRRLAALALELKERGACVVLSNHDARSLRDLYKPEFKMKRVKARRSINRDARKRGGVKELLIW